MPFTSPSLARRGTLGLVLCGALALGLQSSANAQAYPTKPIKIIVGFAPGGGSDFMARLIAHRLTEKLGQSVIVDNKPGAGGNLGAELALKSTPDGYTLYLAAASYTVNPALYKLSFDPIKDMTPIAELARGPFVVAISPKVSAKSLKEFVDLAKKQPGKFAYASSGAGSIVHMATEYFLDAAKIDVLHVPYKGSSPALTATIADQTQLIFGTVSSTLPFVKSGQLRALAVTTARRLGALPDAPTLIESGYPDYAVLNWHGLIAPKGVPADVVKILNRAVNEVLGGPGMGEQMASDGLTPAAGTPEAFGQMLGAETARWAAIAKQKNIKLD